MLDVGFVNLVSIISQNPKVTAINSCIEVDLTGQVVSDSIGTRLYSGNKEVFCLMAYHSERVCFPTYLSSVIQLRVKQLKVVLDNK